MKCPICQKEVKLDDPEMPFCSAHCREIDLGNWATEKYVISTPADSIVTKDTGSESAEPEADDE